MARHESCVSSNNKHHRRNICQCVQGNTSDRGQKKHLQSIQKQRWERQKEKRKERLLQTFLRYTPRKKRLKISVHQQL